MSGYRYVVLDKYLLVYSLREDTVEVTRIIHASLDYTRLL